MSSKENMDLEALERRLGDFEDEMTAEISDIRNRMLEVVTDAEHRLQREVAHMRQSLSVIRKEREVERIRQKAREREVIEREREDESEKEQQQITEDGGKLQTEGSKESLSPRSCSKEEEIRNKGGSLSPRSVLAGIKAESVSSESDADVPSSPLRLYADTIPSAGEAPAVAATSASPSSSPARTRRNTGESKTNQAQTSAWVATRVRPSPKTPTVRSRAFLGGRSESTSSEESSRVSKSRSISSHTPSITLHEASAEHIKTIAGAFYKASTKEMQQRARRSRPKKAKDAFEGATAVSWMVDAFGLHSREEAVAIGQKLITDGYIHRLQNDDSSCGSASSILDDAQIQRTEMPGRENMRNDGDSSQMPSGTTTATASGVSSSSSSNLSPTISPRGLGGSNDGDEDGDTPLARFVDDWEHLYVFQIPVFMFQSHVNKHLEDALTTLLGRSIVPFCVDGASEANLDGSPAGVGGEDALPGVVYEGSFEVAFPPKKGKPKWHRRYCTLEADKWNFYKTEKDTKVPIDSIRIHEIVSIILDESKYNLVDFVSRQGTEVAFVITGFSPSIQQGKEKEKVKEKDKEDKRFVIMLRGAPDEYGTIANLLLFIDGLKYRSRPRLVLQSATVLDSQDKGAYLKMNFWHGFKGAILKSADEEWQYDWDGSVCCNNSDVHKDVKYVWTSQEFCPTRGSSVNYGTGRFDGVNLWWFPPMAGEGWSLQDEDMKGMQNCSGSWFRMSPSHHFIYNSAQREYVDPSDPSRTWKWTRHFLAHKGGEEKEWIVEGRLPEPVVMLLQILRYYWNEFWRDTNTDSAANKIARANELASTVKAPRNGSSSPSSSSSISGSVPHHTSSGIAPPLMTLSPPVEFNQEVEKGKAKEKSKEKSQEKLKDKSKDNKAKKDDKGKEGDLEAEGVAERDNSESESSNSVALGRELSCEDDVSFTSASRSASINTKIDLDDDASVVRSIRISTKVKRSTSRKKLNRTESGDVPREKGPSPLGPSPLASSPLVPAPAVDEKEKEKQEKETEKKEAKEKEEEKEKEKGNVAKMTQERSTTPSDEVE